MDDDKNKGFKGSYKASPVCVQETSPILYKLNCRITRLLAVVEKCRTAIFDDLVFYS